MSETYEQTRKELADLKAEAAEKRRLLSELMIKERRERMERERRELEAKIEQSKQGLAEFWEIKRDAKFDRAWRIAWEERHSSGIGAVEDMFGNLVELIKP